MAKRLQLRGGTTTEHSTFTGAVREVTVDTDKDTLVVHDAVTTGGFPVVSNKTTTTADMSFVVDEDNMISDLATKVPTQQSVKAYVSTEISSALASEMAYKGGYNAATNTPNLDAASPVAISVGDVYTVTVAGTFFTASVNVGDMVLAEVTSPTLETEWTRVDNSRDLASTIKTKYESNADTNAYTDAEKTRAALQTGTNTGDNAGVTSITVTSPIVSSGGATPDLTHATTAGNKHMPTGGTVGQILKNTASGTATWQNDGSITYTVGDGGLTEINFTTADNSKLDGIEPYSTADQTAAQLLTAVKTVDGAGSGLDADLLDGVQGASYAKLASPALTGTPTAPTQASGNNTTRLATTAFVTAATIGGIAAGAVGTTELAANAVTTAKLPNLVASTDYSITFSGSLTTASLTKESELIIARSGTVKIRGKMSVSYSGKNSIIANTYWRLYKNGVGQGSTYSENGPGTTTNVQDLTVAAGDLIQVYGYTTQPSDTSASVEVQVGFTGYLTAATRIV